MKYGLLAKMMFVPVDLLYGRKGSYTKFAMLEIIALHVRAPRFHHAV